jgi:hypothetical protein
MNKRGFLIVNRLLIIVFLVLFLITISNTVFALDVTHTMPDLFVYDDYIDYDETENVNINLGSFSEGQRSWRVNPGSQISATGDNAVIVTLPYNSMIINPEWVQIEVIGSSIESIEVSGSEDNGQRMNVPSNSWTPWQVISNGGIHPEIINKQFIKLKIKLESNGRISRINLRYNTTLKDHPRLNIDSVQDLKERCNSDYFDEVCDYIRSFNGHYNNEQNEYQLGVPSRLHALKYLLDGDQASLTDAKNDLRADLNRWQTDWGRLALGPDLERLIITYDWIYNGLTPTERAEFEADLIDFTDYIMNDVWQHGEFNNHNYAEQSSAVLLGIALYGGENHETAQEYYDIGFDYLYNQWIPTTNYIMQGMGGWHESLSYFSGEMASHLARTMDGVRTATNVNFYETASGLRQIPNWYLYSTIPHDKSVIHLADNGMVHWSRDLSSSSDENGGLRGYLSGMMKNFDMLGYDTEAKYSQYLIKNLIGEIYPSGTSSMYRGTLVPELLWYDPTINEQNIENTRLTGYSPILGEVIMREGTDEDDTTAMYHCGDYYGGHSHDDSGHFSIWYKGYLAVDSGHYTGWPSSHLKNYAGRTIAHNTLTIYKPGETFARTDLNDGGQQHGNSPNYYLEDRGHDMCDMTLYESTNYNYINSDFTKSYNPDEEKANLVTRQFLFFRPDKFIVFDRVESTDASYKKKYLLHSQNDMTISENLITLIENDGKLFSKTLLPSNPEIVKVGGSGQEWSVEGVNFPMTKEIALPYAGKYRVEISPADENTFDNFLHVMQTADVDVNNMEDSELFQSGNSIGARIDNKIALFSRTGESLSQMQYTFTSSASTQNIIVDLKSGYEYTVEDDGTEIDTITANEYGVIEYDLNSGDHDIVIYEGSLQLCSDINGANCIEGSCENDYSSCNTQNAYCENGLSCCSGTCNVVMDCLPYETEPCNECYENDEMNNIISEWIDGSITSENLLNYIDVWKSC